VLAENHTLADEHDKLTRENDSLTVERNVILASIDEVNLKLYEQLRQQRRGVAVARVNDGACAACGGNLTPGLQQSAKSPSQITRCPNCNRILYNN
jgi:predicted  nucleic acid-binding Zn-ribbon protein